MVAQPMSTHSADVYLWKSIRKVAGSFASKTKPHVLHRIHSLPEVHDFVDIQPLVLPIPHELLVPILTMEAGMHFRQRLHKYFTTKIVEMQQLYQSSYTRAFSVMAGTHQTKQLLQKAYLSLYERQCLPLIKTQISGALMEVARRRAQHKPVFNNDFTPILEAYFEECPYPSTADKLTLAHKSQMTPRQIEVWFQNHRSRSRKEGRKFSRSNGFDVDRAASVLNDLTSRPSPAPSSSRCTSECPSVSSASNCEEQMGTASADGDFLRSDRPTHVFPVPYPNNYLQDPFQRTAGMFDLPADAWTRCSRSKPLTRDRIPMDVDGLCEEFQAKLHLRTSARKEGKCSYDADRSWYPMAGTSQKAPHPAHVRRLDHLPDAIDLESDPVPRLPPISSTFSRHTFPSRLPDWNAHLMSPDSLSLFSPRRPSSQSSSSSRSVSSSSSVSLPPPPTPPVMDTPLDPSVLYQHSLVQDDFFDNGPFSLNLPLLQITSRLSTLTCRKSDFSIGITESLTGVC